LSQAYSSALQSIIGEFKNISPEISSAFIFEKNGELFAVDDNAVLPQTECLIDAFNGLAEFSDAIGDIVNLSVHGVDKQLNVTAMNKLYLATVFSRAADPKIVTALTNVIVPSVVNLYDEISSEPPSKETEQTLPAEEALEAEPAEQEPEDSENEEVDAEEKPTQQGADSLFEQSPANQFMIEKLSGFMVQNDTVRLDSEVISKWRDACGGKEISEVNIMALDGKEATCKLKPIKEAKNAKGIIQVPEKILQTLKTSNGKLVVVKPVLGKSEAKKK
jgi:hypothetical protein